MNHIVVGGNLGADPEVRFTSGGQKVTTLRLATKSRKAGKEETIWWKITVWGEQFDKMMPHLKKGSGIIVSGNFEKPEIYTDKNGSPQVSLQIKASDIMFSPFGSGNRSESAQGEKAAQPAPVPAHAAAALDPFDQLLQGQQGASFNDDEIPF